MKLAEALMLRADYQRRIAQLKVRLQMNARIQEGDAAAEDPQALLAEIEQVAADLERMIQRINRTNSVTALDETQTLADALAARDLFGHAPEDLRRPGRGGRHPSRPLLPVRGALRPGRERRRHAGAGRRVRPAPPGARRPHPGRELDGRSARIEGWLVQVCAPASLPSSYPGIREGTTLPGPVGSHHRTPEHKPSRRPIRHKDPCKVSKAAASQLQPDREAQNFDRRSVRSAHLIA